MFLGIFQVKSVNYDLPQNATPSGNCTAKMSYITLDWNNGRANLSLSMAFKEEEKEWEMYNLNFTANSVNNQPLTTNGTGWFNWRAVFCLLIKELNKMQNLLLLVIHNLF